MKPAPTQFFAQLRGLFPEILAAGLEVFFQNGAMLGFRAAAVLDRTLFQGGGDFIGNVTDEQLRHDKMIAYDSSDRKHPLRPNAFC